MNCISQICCFHVALISCLAIIRVYHIFVSISTCALREEGDTEHHPAAGKHQYFYPRPPRGGRLISPLSRSFSYRFLSTSSARRATREIFSRTTQRPDFYPRPPRGGRLHPCTPPHQSGLFLSTPSARRATLSVGQRLAQTRISIHALREEGDSLHHVQSVPIRLFLSTPSARRATRSAASPAAERYYFYPRPPRGGRPGISCWISRTGRFLSTPSARRATGLDGLACGDGNADFYPRPPRGGRQTHGNKAPPEYRFLSTPSARRATSCGAYHQSVRHYFYPRPPRGGRPDGAGHGRRTCCISIHALREEGDCAGYVVIGDTLVFLSTPSARRATLWLSMSMMITAYFYPRPPRGGRPRIACAWPTSFIFLSTPSARRATDPL